VWDTLHAFSFTPRFIPEGAHVFARHLLLPELRPWTASFYPPLVYKMAERLKAEAQKRVSPETIFPTQVYLSRKKRGVRCVENEEELLPVLQKEGFEAVFFEDWSVWEQIAMMSRAERFVSLHGAGFSNMMFMRPGTMVVEIINETYARAEYTFPFWKLAHSIDLKYWALFCPVSDKTPGKLAREGRINGDEKDYLVNRNVVVDVNRLQMILSDLTLL
jgi:capsular polysaccharide biosynthesis protein